MMVPSRCNNRNASSDTGLCRLCFDGTQFESGTLLPFWRRLPFALNLTWSGYLADQIAAAKANGYRHEGIERAMVGKNASSNGDCTGGASTCGRQPLLSNLATSNDSSWIRAHCGLDRSLGIRAC